MYTRTEGQNKYERNFTELRMTTVLIVLIKILLIVLIHHISRRTSLIKEYESKLVSSHIELIQSCCELRVCYRPSVVILINKVEISSFKLESYRKKAS